MALAAAMALFYTAAMLSISIWLFARREFP
jgi:hypothetical protein